jgi:IS30 family transposase
MAKGYHQLTLEERCAIARLREAGQSCRQIAAALDRPPSTISRELRRNRGKQVGYRPSYAHEQAKARRWTGSRLERDGDLRRLVLDRLRHGWSPEQIAGRLACDKAATGISHESIYRFIYAQIRRTNDGSWRHYLPRAKAKRGWRGRKGGSPASFIQGRVSIAQRPEAANDRAFPGH